MSAAYASRFEAVFLCTHSRGPKLSHAQAARYMQKSESFVAKWVKRYSKFKHVDDLPERGKSRKTSFEEDKQISELFLLNPSISVKAAHIELKKKGVDVSLTTVRRRLCELKSKDQSTPKKPLPSEKHVDPLPEEMASNLEVPNRNLRRNL